MAAINYLTSKYGTSAWSDITVFWDGDGTTFRLYVNGSPTPIYTGAGKSFAFTGDPDSRYDFTLEADVALVTSSAGITVFTRALPAPVGLVSTALTATQIDLSWQAVVGADSYEVADVTDNYTLLDTGILTTTFSETGLDPQSRHSYGVRTVMNGVMSRWSAPITLITPPSYAVTAGVYDYGADAIHTWQAGRAGSTSPAWRPEADDWFHGDGFVWGDNAGSQSTWFFYTTATFAALTGATVTAFSIWVERATYGGDPGSVTSRFFAHSHASKPVGEPTTAEQYDGYTLERGVGAWVPLPTTWADALIDGTREGIAWGGCPERYQVSTHTDISASPRLGDLKITVS